ncbi:MAG: hypothetical protein ACM3PY_10940 [Omnitrophica WOR_2 bacterium]
MNRREQSDRIVMRSIPFTGEIDPLDELTRVQTWFENGSRYERHTIDCGSRKLTATTRRDPDVNTVWQVEHLLKDVNDLRAFLELPISSSYSKPDISGVIEAEQILSDSGIVMIDMADRRRRICFAALPAPALIHRCVL